MPRKKKPIDPPAPEQAAETDEQNTSNPADTAPDDHFEEESHEPDHSDVA